MERITITSTRYNIRYHTFSLSLALFGGYLKRVTVKFIKKCMLIFFFKKLTVTHGNPLQTALRPC